MHEIANSKASDLYLSLLNKTIYSGNIRVATLGALQQQADEVPDVPSEVSSGKKIKQKPVCLPSAQT